MVAAAGVEPARLERQWILSPLRLPVPPDSHILEREMGIEPTTLWLETRDSNLIELLSQIFKVVSAAWIEDSNLY